MGSSEEQLKVYKEVFAQFDTDGSGAVDTDEMATMVESLGMLVTKTELAAMIKAADADGSGEIEFNEFVQVIETAAAQGVAAKGGMSFSALISRRANSGPPMCWRGDKAGPGIAVDAAKTTATREGEGWGVQLLDCWMSGSGFDIASCLLEFEYPLSGELYVGVVGRNFNPTEWNEPFDKCTHATAARASDGAMFKKAMAQPNAKMAPIATGEGNCRFQIELNMKEQSIVCNCLSKDGETVASTVTVEGVPPEVAVAVAFGPTPSGKPMSCKVIGSSSEKTGRKNRRASQDLWDDDSKQDGNEGSTDAMAKMAISMAM